jgi:choline-sulfatase
LRRWQRQAHGSPRLTRSTQARTPGMLRCVKTQPANLLFICSDEHQRAVTGCYGNRLVRTPHIDALASRGVRFANAYCNAPLCVPSRASFATGRYGHEVHSWCNGSGYTGAYAQSWGHRLTEQGHNVTTVGKLHYRAASDPTGFPDQRIAMNLHGGVGDVRGLLRGRMPVAHAMREHVTEAGAGESEYLRYDRAIAEQAVRWLKEEARGHERPWVLFVSFLYPHYPLIAPSEFCRLYSPDAVPLPILYRECEWPRHPALDLFRRLRAHDEPYSEAELRRAIATYYAMVTFMDEQLGRVLTALAESGQASNTRILYTTDHGEHLGDHGLWWKRAMYESAAAVPLVLAGPGVPSGRVIADNVSLVDLFPTIVESVGARLTAEDRGLRGRSLFQTLAAGGDNRSIFAEYHGAGSAAGSYMLRTERYKYVHYCDGPAQLFDMREDRLETRDLANDPAHHAVLTAHERVLRAICDPDEVDRQAKADQRQLIDAVGGEEAILQSKLITFFPPPSV